MPLPAMPAAEFIELFGRLGAKKMSMATGLAVHWRDAHGGNKSGWKDFETAARTKPLPAVAFGVLARETPDYVTIIPYFASARRKMNWSSNPVLQILSCASRAHGSPRSRPSIGSEQGHHEAHGLLGRADYRMQL
jgi:hypothetical protein